MNEELDYQPDLAEQAPEAPLISVVLPCYCHVDYIAEAIDSVVAQTYPRLELIIIDDASDDGSAEKIAELLSSSAVKGRFERIEFVAKAVNTGAHNSINEGLRLAAGDWLTVLNTDDRFDPSRLDKLITAALAARTHFAFSDVMCIDESGARNSSELALSFETAAMRAVLNMPTVGFGFLTSQIAISTGNFFFSRELWNALGGFKDLRYCHDWEFALHAVLYCEPAYVAEPLYMYRLHSGNSFRQLGSVARQETRKVVQAFVKAQFTSLARNPLAPTADNWPGVYELHARGAGLF